MMLIKVYAKINYYNRDQFLKQCQTIIDHCACGVCTCFHKTKWYIKSTLHVVSIVENVDCLEYTI